MKRIVRLALEIAALLSLPGWASPVWPPRTFSAYYGKIEAATFEELARFDLVILHPGDDGKNLTSETVARLRRTGSRQTLVGYVSIGEESASPGGPPREGQDESGPSYVGKDLKQHLAQAGYPAYFLDQQRMLFDDDGFPRRAANGRFLQQSGQDGHPDENGVWGSYYVKADEPLWQAKVFERLEHLDKLGLDGFFLDTVDTASPWGDYGWTSAGMLELVEAIRARYPDKRIVANRGLFYLGQSDRYAKAIDAVLFESLLTSYREETQSASVSQWARWHVQALDDDVIPAQKRTGIALLVLDYLDPEHPDAPVLVQSARSLLEGASHYCLSFSHPALAIPGWTAEQLLGEPSPLELPVVTRITPKEEALGRFVIEVEFDGPVPEGALLDLRLTTRTDVTLRRAAELPLVKLVDVLRQGNVWRLQGEGLNKQTSYRLFLRLISRANVTPAPFVSTSLSTAPSNRLGQVGELSSESVMGGLSVSFEAKEKAALYRVYRSDGKSRSLLAEAAASPVMLPGLPSDQAVELVVSPVDAAGHEGYPSPPHVAVPRSVLPPQPPGAAVISGDARQARFEWPAVDNAVSYRLHAVPEGQSYRLPLVCKETSVTVSSLKKGRYRVFVTAVDKSGNQSRPGPATLWTAK